MLNVAGLVNRLYFENNSFNPQSIRIDIEYSTIRAKGKQYFRYFEIFQKFKILRARCRSASLSRRLLSSDMSSLCPIAIRVYHAGRALRR
jgi:hypothetical protein